MDELENDGREPEEITDGSEPEEIDEDADGEQEEETEESLLKSLGLDGYKDFEELAREHAALKAKAAAAESAPKKEKEETQEEAKPFLPRGQMYNVYQKRVAGKDPNDPVVRDMLAFAQQVDEENAVVFDKVEKVLNFLVGKVQSLDGVREKVEWDSIDPKVRSIVPRETVAKVMAKFQGITHEEAIKYVLATDDTIKNKLKGGNPETKKQLPPSLLGRTKPSGNGASGSWRDFVKNGELDANAMYAKLGTEKGAKQYDDYLRKAKVT